MGYDYFSKVLRLLLIISISKVTAEDVKSLETEILQTKDSVRTMPCVRMEIPDCLGNTLPYSMSSNGIVQKYYSTENEIQQKLHEFRTSLQHIPSCWKVVQPLLCMIFRPQCFNDHVEMPSQEMCRRIERPCRIIFQDTLWPEFINCSNRELFPQLNNQPIHPLKFNSPNSCLPPLVPTNNTHAELDGIDGCGLPCENPLYSLSEHQQTHSLILWSAIICSIFNIAAILTYLINWPTGTHSDRAIFFINCCFFVSCIGWLLQFTNITREAIVCHADYTLRTSEPSGDSSACITVFVLIYFSLLAAMIWFGILIFTWFMRFNEPVKFDRTSLCFHIAAWGIPFFSTILITNFLNIVDGNSVTGICFIGYEDFSLLNRFMFIPLLMILVAAAGFIVADLKNKTKSPGPGKKSKRIPIAKILTLSLPLLLIILVTLFCHFWEGSNLSKYNHDFKNFVICTILNRMTEMKNLRFNIDSKCQLNSTPDIVKLQLQIMTHFIAGILMSLFICERRTLDSWISFYRRIFKRKPKQSEDSEKAQEMLTMQKFNF